MTTGLRRSEIVTIDLKDYNTRTGLFTIRSGKGNKQRTTYLNTDSRAILKKWLTLRGNQDGYLFNALSKAGLIQHGQLSSQAIYDLVTGRASQNSPVSAP